MAKVITWIMTNGASVIGITQSVVKALKELLTAVINLVSIFIPSFAAQEIVNRVREIINKIDEGLEWVKEKLLGI